MELSSCGLGEVVPLPMDGLGGDYPYHELPSEPLSLMNGDLVSLRDDGEVTPPNVALLRGETIRLFDRTTRGRVALSNYRLLLLVERELVCVPVGLIARVEMLQLVHMSITAKTGATLSWTFPNSDVCAKWLELLLKETSPPLKVDEMFAFVFCDALKQEFDAKDSVARPFLYDDFNPCEVYDEFKRMNFDESSWQVTDVNSDYRVCSTYPKHNIIPRSISKDILPKIAGFRSGNRFPSVVWRSRRTGAVILRCAQPLVGIMLWRNYDDEQFVMAVLKSCRNNPGTDVVPEENGALARLLIVDARNYTAAQMNRIKGGGFEFGEYYERTDICFMGLPNIHAVRDSFEKLIALYATAGVAKAEQTWFTNLEKTGWLSTLSLLIKSSVEIAVAVDQQARPVMVHCTDGWDRTPQLTALTQILLDPNYRTFKGFRTLVEREWLDFGHKFGDRCGHGQGARYENERSPIFLQWLDSVHQVMRQFPTAFEFNETFLIKLSVHVYSGLFGTFLYNSARDRAKEELRSKTCSVWHFLLPESNWRVVNSLYRVEEGVLYPSYHPRDLIVWQNVYMHCLNPKGSACKPTPRPAPTNPTSITANGTCPSVAPITRSRSETNIAALAVGEAAALVKSTADLPTSTSEHHVRAESEPEQDREEAILAEVVTFAEDLETAAPEVAEEEFPVCEETEEVEKKEEVVQETLPELVEAVAVLKVDEEESTVKLENHSEESPQLVVNGGPSTSTSLEEVYSCSPSWPRPMEVSQLGSSTDTLTDTTVNQTQPMAQLKRDSSENDIPENGESTERSLSPSSGKMSETEVSGATPDCPLAHLHLNGKMRPLHLNIGRGHPPGDTVTKSLGYATGSDLSSPTESSGPPTPDTVDPSLSWRSRYFVFPTSPSGLTVETSSNNEDLDGLAVPGDAVTEGVHDLKKRLEREMRILQRKNCHLQNMVNRLRDGKRLGFHEHDRAFDGEIGSPLGRQESSRSSVASSFELIDESDARYQSWQPDHLASSCNQCFAAFTTFNRKHHCRSCGYVFCSECSSNFVPVPEQQLFTEVRVCKRCFVRQQPSNGAHMLCGDSSTKA